MFFPGTTHNMAHSSRDQPYSWLTYCGQRDIPNPPAPQPPANFATCSMAEAIIAHDSKRSNFAQIAYIAFLFASRVPSKALVPQRAYMGGGTNWPHSTPPPNRHALYWVLVSNPDREDSPYAFPAAKTFRMDAS